MDDILFAMTRAARKADGGISGVAQRLGKRPKTLMSKLDPAEDIHQPTIGEFIAVVLDTQDMQPVELLCELFGGEFVTKTSAVMDDTQSALLHMLKEIGDVVREMELSMEDNHITPTERSLIRKEISEMEHATSALKNTLTDQCRLIRRAGER